MTFTEVFGGTTIYPSGVSYRAVALSANQTLAWPVETATNANIVAQIMDVTPSIASLSILMPPANEASVGETTLFFNAGSFAFTVKDNGGNTIVSIAPGLSYQVYLIGNSTVNGTWRSTQYAAGTSSATAGSLVGAGIKAINTTLNQSMAVTSLNTNYTIGDADRSEAFLWSGGAGTLTLPSAVTVGNDWFCHVRNNGTGAISLATASGQLINGALSLAFNPGDSAIIICDGSGFFTIGFGQSASFAFDYVSIDLTSQTSPYTLAGANLNRIAYSFGGTLTGAMTIHIPATFQQYWLANETIGGFPITVKVAGQTGVIIGNGVRAICYCNGTDLVDADTSSFSFPVSVAQGGTGAVNESGARVNLGGTSTGIAVFTAPSAASARSTLSAAASGANSDITSLSGLTTPLSVGQGGTGTATAFTSGSVVFAGASGVYSQDNANFFWDNASDRLGVGTNTPSHALDVFSAANGVVRVGGGNSTNQGAAYYVKNASNSNTLAAFGDRARIFGGTPDQLVSIFTGAAPLTFDVNGAGRMRITSGGAVGIGTDSPSYKLEVRTDAASGFNWISSNNNIATGSFGAGFLATTGAGASYFYMRGDGVAYVENSSNNPLGFATNAQERMRITAGGNLLVGTTTSLSRLTVGSDGSVLNEDTITIFGNLSAVSTGQAISWYQNTSSVRSGYVALNSNSGGTESELHFGTTNVFGVNNATTKMVIVGSGNVGIGTTAPGAKLEVSNGSSACQVRIRGGTAGVSAPELQFYGNSSDHNWTIQGNHSAALQFFKGTFGSLGTELMRLDVNGDFSVGTTSTLNTTSKARIYQGSGDKALEIYSNSSACQLTISDNANLVAIRESGGLNLMYNNAGTLTDGLRLTHVGNVGIGTTSPGSRLHVAGGSMYITGSGTYTEPAAVAGVFAFDSTNGDLNISARSNGGNTFMRFFTSNSGTGFERMRIKAGGQVRFIPLSSAPAGAEAGDVYYDSGTNKLRCYNGTIWNDLF